MILGLEEDFYVGQDTFFDSISPTIPFGVVFEDDLTTGYFYAVDLNSDLKMLDALHIYDVENVIDKHKQSKLQITWTDDGLVASLLINDFCHAIFDFESKAGYCRNAFPETRSDWCLVKNRNLTEGLIQEILKTRK